MSPRSDLQIYENLPVPVVLARGDHVLYANLPFARLLGVGQPELEGASVRDLIERHSVPDEREFIRGIEEARRHGFLRPQVLWTRLRSADGVERPRVALRANSSSFHHVAPLPGVRLRLEHVRAQQRSNPRGGHEQDDGIPV